tara:strand:+ start:242 stop:496 length:255 start_codon:yes stop_codon:yes gene_type:complete
MPKDKPPKPKAELIPPPKHKYQERPKIMQDAAKTLDELHKARIKAKQQRDAERTKDIEVDKLTLEEQKKINQKINQLREGSLYK